jgi:transposase
MIPLSYADQVVEGLFEHALNEIVEEHLDRSVFNQRYRNDATGREAYDPRVLLKVVLFGYYECHSSPYEIAAGSAKRIGYGSAKRIHVRSAKRIRAWGADYWTDVPGSGDVGGMTAKRTDMHKLQELVRLHRGGTGPREVARLLGMGPNTERLYRIALEKAGLLEGEPSDIPELETLKAAVVEHVPRKVAAQQESSVSKWRSLVENLHSDGCGPTAIYDRLRLEQEGFNGSLAAVKRLVATMKRERGPLAKDVAIPVETEPGDVAHVDFGYAGYRMDPQTRKLRKAWVFVMVLGHSRDQFAKVVFDQRTETWLALHEEAFRAFGGVPRTVVPDNLKAAVIRAAFGADDRTSELNRSYRELARHYGFKIDPTPPRSPKKKGKVESGVKYAKNNALKGREGESLDETNRLLAQWTREIAGMRIHGTTGKRPREVFEAVEKAALLELPARPYEPVVWKQATVHQDSHVVFDRRLYSVPWRHIGRQVWVRATPSTVAVYFDDERVATHRRGTEGYRSTDDGHLPAERAHLRHRNRRYWEERADRLAEEVGRFVRELFDSDDVLSQLRQVQAVVSHLEKFPAERAQGACRRASFYGSHSYQAVKNILTKALDLEPLPTSKAVATAWADPPRFARDANEWRDDQEVSRERH